MKYQVVVYGSVLYETNDMLIASEMKRLYSITWGNGVKVRKVC